MPSAAAQDILQAILERRAAEKRRTLGATAASMVLPFANSRIAGAFEASEPVRQVDELSAPITLPFAARNQFGDWQGRMPNVVKAIADPRTSPFSPAAVARLFMDPAGEAGRQVETGEQLAEPFTQFNDPNVDPVENAFDLASVVGMGGLAGAGERAGLGSAGGRLRPPTHLPMDEASRMARAKEMGFETDAYKGAYPYDYKTGPSRNWKGEEIDNIGAKPELLTEFNSPNSPYAGFFSDDKEVANRFATLLGEGSVYPVKLKFKNPLIIDGKGKPAAAFQFEEIAKREGFLQEMESFRKAFETGDYDGVIIKNTRDEGTVYVPKNPNQVRSKFANFDPAQSESGDILAAGGKGGAKVGLALQGAKEKPQNNLPRY